MGDDDSLFDRARRAVAGPTPAERAAELDDRAADDPSALDPDDVDELIDLLDSFDDGALDAGAVADARDTLETASRLSDADEVVAAAEDAPFDG